MKSGLTAMPRLCGIIPALWLVTAKTIGGVTTPKGFRRGRRGGTCGIKASGKPDLMVILADAPLLRRGDVHDPTRSPTRPGHRAAAATSAAAAPRPSSPTAAAPTSAPATAASMTRSRCAGSWLSTPRRIPTKCNPRARHAQFDGRDRAIPPDGKNPGGDRGCHDADVVPRGLKADAAAARAIMTTDLVPKSTHRTFKLGGKTVQLAGIAKGSGMIAPNMATMLAFAVTTDAAIALGGAPNRPARCGQTCRYPSIGSASTTTRAPATRGSCLASARRAIARSITAATGRDYGVFSEALTDLVQRPCRTRLSRMAKGRRRCSASRVEGLRNQKRRRPHRIHHRGAAR